VSRSSLARDPTAAALRGPDGRVRERPSIRLRAVVLALLLVPLNVSSIVWGNWVNGDGALAQSMAAPAVAGIFLLGLLNTHLRRRRPRWALTRGELIALYSTLAISTGLCATPWDWGGSLSSVITWPIWNATPGNRWEETIWPHLPAWLVVGNRDVLRGFFLGASSPYRWPVLRAWAQPIVWWTAWAAVVLGITLCLNVIVRRRWSEEEQLPFPMTVLPVQLSQEGGGLLTAPLFWVGVALSLLVALDHVAARFAPALPSLPTNFDYGAYVANNRPWNATRIPHFSWQPWHLGLSYLMPVDLAFSLVVFNLFWRAELISARQLGWSTSSWGGFPYGEQQVMGAYFALIAIFVWLERRYLLQVLRKAIGLPSSADDRDEALSYRAAVGGVVAGAAFLWWFFARTGADQTIILPWLLIYFLMLMVMGRLRAQLGPPSNEMYGTMPDFAFVQFPGTRALSPRTLGLLSLLRPFMREQTANPAPAQLEALRMSEQVKMRPRRLAWLMAAVVPLGMLTYFWASLHIGYRVGLGAKASEGITFHAVQSVGTMEEWLNLPAPADWGGVAAIGVGLAITLALMALKLQFPAWPLHPVAFPLGYDMTVDDMLPAIFFTWLLKTLLLRYGGLRAHRRALPLFLGLITGSGTASFLLAVLSTVSGVRL
jgi:hypothetical protein